MSVEIHPQYLFDEDGEPQSVLLSFAEFRAMLEELEDTADLKALETAMANAKGARPLADVFAELDAERK